MCVELAAWGQRQSLEGLHLLSRKTRAVMPDDTSSLAAARVLLYACPPHLGAQRL